MRRSRQFVHPGFTDTPPWEIRGRDEMTAEVAALVEFLASDEARSSPAPNSSSTAVTPRGSKAITTEGRR